ncbi:MAG: cob(I)yrinic acid a,c-diamide adenosyltransferase [Chloroflexota bacterium]|nr:cob(I)yrinic acid a,c-diamide adenosyltransferase [Chloroflexota bacterium]
MKEKGKRGFVIVYTGDGKGKTTAAIGMAMRAIGRGWKVLMVQFMKGTWHYAELDTAKRLAPDFEIVPMGKGFYRILDDHYTDAEHRAAALAALQFARAKMGSGEYDLLILDEVNDAVSTGLLPLSAVMQLLDAKPADFSIVLTGRGAPQALIDRADLVTEMREVKHPYQQGILAQKGIDF